uniref:Uncharacterized protein n=1 Tax=Panagrolaimus superbus TaxID=310955 RepID=A0A914Z7J4_9BILA
MMSFKSSQKLLNPNEQKLPKKRTMAFYNCEMPYKKYLYNLLIDNIYLLTSEKPITSQQLLAQHLLLGQDQSFERAIQIFGCFSITDFIRKNAEHFIDYLEITATVKDGSSKNVVNGKKPELNFFNKKIKSYQPSSLLMKGKMILDE